MLYVICGLIFAGVVALSFYLGWHSHTCYTFDKLDEIVTEGIDSLNKYIKTGETEKRLPFYEGYCYALRLAAIRLGAIIEPGRSTLDGINIRKD